jgi:hypothetical protein
MSDPFATAQELADFIGTTVPADLARMQNLIASASATIRNFTGQILSPVQGDIAIFPPSMTVIGQMPPWPHTWNSYILLPERPVTNVSSITVNTPAVPVTTFGWTPSGVVYRTDARGWWFDTATVTYDHGYPEGSDDLANIKKICLQMAARAYTLNERSSSEFMGQTLAEAAGYAPEIFLTPGEKDQLEYGRAFIG